MEKLESKFRSLKPAFHRLEEEAKFILGTSLNKAGIKSHSLVSRVKVFESFRDKIVRKNITDPFENIDDLVGVRVVCLLRSDIPKLGQLIHKEFTVLAEDNKLDGVEVNAFGYQSVHFVVRLPQSCTGPRYDGLHDLRLEIQVRTLAMDAWAALSHYLDYKSESDVPKELRKDFFALSGLFYVADTHFEMFYAARQQSKIAAQDTVYATPMHDQELNLDTATAYLSKRYPDREHCAPQDLSELISQLFAAGYTTLDKLHLALEATADAFAQHEVDNPPGSRKGNKYTDVGVVRLSLGIIDPAFAKSMGYAANRFTKCHKLIRAR